MLGSYHSYLTSISVFECFVYLLVLFLALNLTIIFWGIASFLYDKIRCFVTKIIIKSCSATLIKFTVQLWISWKPFLGKHISVFAKYSAACWLNLGFVWHTEITAVATKHGTAYFWSAAWSKYQRLWFETIKMMNDERWWQFKVWLVNCHSQNWHDGIRWLF